MFFYDDQERKYLPVEEDEQHDGFPDVIADSIYAIGSALICAIVAVSAWVYKNGGHLPWQ